MMDPLNMMLKYPPSQCAAAVLLIARVLSLIIPSWTPELTTRTLDVNQHNSDNDAPTKWGYSCRWLYVTVTDTLNRYLRFGMNVKRRTLLLHKMAFSPR